MTLSDPFCVGRHRDEFRALIASDIDVLFANEEEITMLYDVATFDEAASRVEHDCEISALTRGALGSVVVSGGARHVIPADPVPRVVDTTGAGDLYAAGVIYGLTHGHDLETCGRLGSLAAAEVISHLGARPEVSLTERARPLLG
jgi:sugar/nucleoside kinase (ribokinase family)